jgi:hypothetical protein
MKVLRFQPGTIPEVRSRPPGASRETGPTFEAELQGAAGRSGVIDKITAENRLARQGAVLEDAAAAGGLLSSLLASVAAARPEDLRKVHDIDGILYYYQL